VGGDLFIAAGDVVFDPAFRGEGDTRIHATRVLFDGELQNDLRVSGRAVEINGFVDGDVYVRYRGDLVIGDEAHITGALISHGPRSARISSQARIDGEVSGTVTTRADRGDILFVSVPELLAAINLLFSLSLGFSSVLLVLLFPRFSSRVSVYVVRRGIATVGYGALLFFGGLALVFVLFLSMIGLYAGIFVMMGLIALCMLASLLSPVLAGYVISGWIAKEAQLTWYWTIIGSIALHLLLFLPILGPVVRILFFFAVLGSLARGIYDVWWVNRREPIDARL
jgi:hypothetical protein